MHKTEMIRYLLIVNLFLLAGCNVKEDSQKWPDDVNGQVFSSLEEHGFDFEKEHLIDINLDFDHWPLSEEELAYVKTLYPDAVVINPKEGEDIGNGVDVGFMQFQVTSKLSYEYITNLQKQITENISKVGGWCNSWGVMQD